MRRIAGILSVCVSILVGVTPSNEQKTAVGAAQANGQKKAYICHAEERLGNTGFQKVWYSKAFIAGTQPDRYEEEFLDFVAATYGTHFDAGFSHGYCRVFDSLSEAQTALGESLRIERSNRSGPQAEAQIAREFGHLEQSDMVRETNWSYSGNEKLGSAKERVTEAKKSPTALGSEREVSTASRPTPPDTPAKRVKHGCGGCILGTPHCVIPKPPATCLAK